MGPPYRGFLGTGIWTCLVSRIISQADWLFTSSIVLTCPPLPFCLAPSSPKQDLWRANHHVCVNASDALDPGLQAGVSCHVVLGIEPGCSRKAVSAPNH